MMQPRFLGLGASRDPAYVDRVVSNSPAAQAGIIRANPDEALCVLHDCHCRSLRHSLFYADVIELQTRLKTRLSKVWCRSEQAQQHKAECNKKGYAFY